MYQSVRELVDQVAVHITSCPTPMIENAVLAAARDFCIMTRCHQVKGSVTAQPGKLAYEFIANEPYTKVVDVINPSHAGFVSVDTLTLDAAATGSITADLVLVPSHRAKKVWAPLTMQYADGIVSGALSRLYRQPAAAHFNPELARQEQTRYADELHNARMAIKPPSQVKQRGHQWL
jgi:hypothetical protein